MKLGINIHYLESVLTTTHLIKDAEEFFMNARSLMWNIAIPNHPRLPEVHENLDKTMEYLMEAYNKIKDLKANLPTYIDEKFENLP